MKTDRRIGAVIVVLAVVAGASGETDDEFVREPRGFVEKSSQYDSCSRAASSRLVHGMP